MQAETGIGEGKGRSGGERPKAQMGGLRTFAALYKEVCYADLECIRCSCADSCIRVRSKNGPGCVKTIGCSSKRQKGPNLWPPLVELKVG
jgi:hypothetical protein